MLTFLHLILSVLLCFLCRKSQVFFIKTYLKVIWTLSTQFSTVINKVLFENINQTHGDDLDKEWVITLVRPFYCTIMINGKERNHTY